MLQPLSYLENVLYRIYSFSLKLKWNSPTRTEQSQQSDPLRWKNPYSRFWLRYAQLARYSSN